MPIRKTEERDAPALAFIQVNSILTHFSPLVPAGIFDGLTVEEQTLDWQQFIQENRLILVFEDQDRVVGYAYGKVLDGQWGEVVSMHVLPEFQNQGIGKQLFAAATEALKGLGCSSIRLTTLEHNIGARRLYEKLSGALSGFVAFSDDAPEVREAVYVWPG
ncbi:GNAT family N-acetyltransferase [Deinococcus roseus]|uniref:N-acetyltransferase domain-containing protein n=1 Tax=Deinococcus roseus TaxID=392414 RepID=A0ABQ2D125_9DEIO|nr:GNAT family N-acetyltransferase [Deinococcus roseus]GGJ40825.1 hypothetical protein GCM10008938_28570 [Deinococcus roseus]